MAKYKSMLIVAGIAVIVGVILGSWIGSSISKASANSEMAKLQGQIEKAKKMFPSMPDMRSVNGTVKSVNGNVVTIETPPSANPFEELPTTRKITMGSDTKIIKQTQKDPKDYQAEMDAYQKKISSRTANNPGEPIMPPNFYIETTVKVGDIKVGDQLNADAAENIKTAESFTATTVRVMPSMAGPRP